MTTTSAATTELTVTAEATGTAAPAPAAPGAEPSGSRDSAVRLWLLICGLPAVAALGLWGVAATDVSAAGAYGLLAVLSWQTVAALAVLALLLGVELTGPLLRGWRPALLVGVLIVLLFSLPNLADSAAGPGTGYLHVGFVQYISGHGAVPSDYDARFSWPGFFAAASVLVSMAGLQDARPLLALSPVFFELLTLAPVLLLARSLSRDARTAWLAVVLFFCGVWFGQDYFAPQAVAFVLYASLLGLLAWLIPQAARIGGPLDRVRRRRRRPWRPGLLPRRGDVSARQQVLLELTLVLLLAGLVVCHQLTPVALVAGLTVFSLLGATRARLLWLVGGLLFVLWFSFGAVDFWAGHLDVIFGDVGRLGETLRQGVSNRLGGGTPAYTRMQYLRMALCLVYLSGALTGAWRMRRSRIGRLLIGLSAAPFVLALLQSYGGEVLLRCFLYAMPFLAILSAHVVMPLVAPRPGRRPAAVPVPGVLALAVLVFAASLALLTTRGLNVAFERVTDAQVAAAQYVEATAPDGAKIVVFEPATPLTYAGVTRRRVVDMSGDPRCPQEVVLCAGLGRPQLVFLSRSQEAYGELRRRLPPGWLLHAGLSQLLATGHYRVGFQQQDAVVLVSTRYPTPAVRR